MTNKTLVLIDDDSEDIELFVDVLKDVLPSHSCRSFSDACEALDYLKGVENPPAFIVIDFNLKQMDAEECLIEISKIKKLHSTKLIIYSSATPDRSVLNRLKSASTAFFQKPSSIVEFEEEVKRLLS
jgi:DNA-binding NtrC family response regulator